VRVARAGNRAAGCIARALAVEGASARNVKPPVKEDDHVKRWKGWLFLRRHSGRLSGQRSAQVGTLLFTSSLQTGEGARFLACCQVEFKGSRPNDTDSEDDAGRSDGGRRQHDSSDDRSSTGGGGETEARPEAPRLVPRRTTAARGGSRREAVEGPRRQERAQRLVGGGGWS